MFMLTICVNNRNATKYGTLKRPVLSQKTESDYANIAVRRKMSWEFSDIVILHL